MAGLGIEPGYEAYDSHVLRTVSAAQLRMIEGYLSKALCSRTLFTVEKFTLQLKQESNPDC